MYKYEVRKAIEAFGNLIMMDKEENILCSSMTMEDINAAISEVKEEIRRRRFWWNDLHELFLRFFKNYKPKPDKPNQKANVFKINL